MPKRLDKKAIERAYLIKAQCVGSLIPPGIFEEGEAPDFRLKIDSGLIGIELAEVMRGAVDSKFPPVEVEKFHNEVMGQAKATYFRDSNLVPAAVNLYFNPIIGNSKKDDLASLIVILVRQNIHRAKPTVNLTRNELPPEILAMSITSESGAWYCGEHGGHTLTELIDQVNRQVLLKEEKFEAYKRNLQGCPLWLLLYSRFDVSRGLSHPSDSVHLEVKSSFDKVFWYSELDRALIELPIIRNTTLGAPFMPKA